jgi:hypothetical protein
MQRLHRFLKLVLLVRHGKRLSLIERIDGPAGLSGAIPLFRTKHGRGFQWKARADAVPVRSIRADFRFPGPWEKIERPMRTAKAGKSFRPFHGQKRPFRRLSDFHLFGG